MDRFSGWIEQYLAPPLVRMGNQRHFAAIRAALIRTIPLIIIGSLPLILTSLPVESLANVMAPYAEKLNILYAMTMNFMTLYLAISLGSELARMYEELDAVIVSIVTVACYIITVAPVNLADNVLDVTGFSAKGMFTLFVVAIIVVEFII